MSKEPSKRSRVMGGAEDDVITDVPGMDDPKVSSRAKDKAFADEPDGSRPTEAQHPTDTPPVDAFGPVPERHEPGGPYEDEAADATFFKADYNAEETNKKGGDA